MGKIIVGTGNDDTLLGTTGDDVIIGGAGRDLMAGGQGNDVYLVDNPLDVVFELGNQGTDTVYSSVALSKAYANVENYVFTTNAQVVFSGNDLNNVIQTGGGNDLINGGQGADSMSGGQGNDTYYVDNAFDIVTESANAGNDTVYSSVSHALGANVEALFLTGKGNIDGYGNSLSNTIIGNSGNNVLDGGVGGSDILSGGAGNDTYVLHNAGDLVDESVANANGGGVDTVKAAFSYSLANLVNVENLTIVGDANGTSLTGNALNNTLTGDAGSNILDGGAGVDWMAGGKGSDTYYVDAATDVAFEWANEGIDTVVSTVAIANAYLNVENYVFKTAQDVHLTTSFEDNNIQGGSGNDVINAGSGTNVIYGNAGNDGLVGGANRDWLYGGEGNDWLQGGDGMDTLDGGTGADLMQGGAGGDTYYVDDVGDQIIELAPNGADGDTVISTISIGKLWDNVESVYLQGNQNLNVVGNALNNWLWGNDGDNIINGGGGIDYMAGGKGNDTYHVDNGQDMVDEKIGEGVDTVVTSLNWYKLGENVENLTFNGVGPFEGLGNQQNNVITGGAGNDYLDGGYGSDTLIGGKGDDTYVVDAFGVSGDKVVETFSNADGGGHDTVMAWGSFSLENLVNVEDLWLLGFGEQGVGNALDNMIHGNDADNYLDGGKGADQMIGGMGNDIYMVDNIGDHTFEDPNSGTDTVYSSVALKFADNDVENYNFTTSDDLNFYANNVSNEVHGGSGNDTINGAGGYDRLFGEAGNDTLLGGDQSDVLDGGAGNDTLIGGHGGDFLAGGSGQDRFGFDMSGGGDGNDSVIDFLKAEDILDFSNVSDHNNDGKINLSDLLLSVSSVTDHGAGHAVDVSFDNGSMVTFQGCGTGAVSTITDLVANAATQIQVH